VYVIHIACVQAGWDNSAVVWYSHQDVLLPKPKRKLITGIWSKALFRR